MLDARLTAFLESGCASIVGLVAPDGAPFATRGWGMEVLGGDPPRIRLLLAAGTLRSVGLAPGAAPFAVAVTGADVDTLRSVQVKGVARDVEPATPADEERSARYCDEFLGAVHESDGTAMELLRRLPPLDLVACTLTVEEVYDQTPGPGAGGRLAEGRR